MTERLVDVLNSNRAVLHTHPITIGAPNITSNDTEYETKAAKAAAHAELVPDADLKNLTTRMHVSRGGALAPYRDDRSVLSETKQSRTRLCANSHIFFGRKTAARMTTRRNTGVALTTSFYASVPRRQEGCPEGWAEEQWHRSRQCETP